MLWLGIFVSSVPLSLLTFAKLGGYLNDLIPMLPIAPVSMVAVIKRIDPSWLVLANKPKLDGWIVDETKGQFEFARHVPNSPSFGMPYTSLRSVYQRVQ